MCSRGIVFTKTDSTDDIQEPLPHVRPRDPSIDEGGFALFCM